VVSQGLGKNHTILGIHFGGNEGDIDAEGFIKRHGETALIGPEDTAKHALFTRLQPHLKQGTVTNKHLIALQAASNCWICEGWSEFQFDFTPP